MIMIMPTYTSVKNLKNWNKSDSCVESVGLRAYTILKYSVSHVCSIVPNSLQRHQL